ncbi:ATP-binding protein [Lachnospiraceae bacterium ZAX-1]
MRSLRTQLSLAIMFVVLITVALISFLSNRLINKQFADYIVDQQKVKMDNLVENISQQYHMEIKEWSVDSIHALGMYSMYEGYLIKVVDDEGKNVWDTEHHDMESCAQIMQEISQRMKAHGAVGEFVSHEYELTQHGQTVGSVSIRYFGPYFLSESDFLFLDSLNLVLLIIGGAALLCSFATGWILAKRIARPIKKTADIAKQIADGNYDIQFEGKTKTRELYNLVSAINHLADALAKQENLRRQLTADVAHELRTPLTTLGSHLEAMIEKVWEPTPERLTSCHEEILRLGNMVVDLENLERTESDNLKLNTQSLDLLSLAQSVCGNFYGALKNKNLSLSIKGDPSILSVDKDRISGVITNLMSNAIKYTPNGGNICISIQDFTHKSVFIIEDDGIGIAKDEQPLIFERFYRAEKSRNRDTGGAGIGLAIVKSVVNAHDGTVKVQSEPEAGSKFTVTLPKR